MDNPPQGAIQDPLAPPAQSPAAQPPASAFTWKSQLPPDFSGSPTMQKFPDTKEGLSDAVKSHLSLERLLGHEKVVLPRGKDDVEGRAAFNKALGIPATPGEYGLPDVALPEGAKGMAFDKTKFAEVIHKYHLTPEQAKGVYGEYTEMVKSTYANAVKEQTARVTDTINRLRAEWGDAYQTKVELGQMVINKFSADQEMNDFITATLVSDPRGIKFLAGLGDQFAENKIGDFQYARHSLTPAEAQKEIDSIRQNPAHPYNNDKAPKAERDRAIDYVNGLIKVTRR